MAALVEGCHYPFARFRCPTGTLSWFDDLADGGSPELSLKVTKWRMWKETRFHPSRRVTRHLWQLRQLRPGERVTVNIGNFRTP